MAHLHFYLKPAGRQRLERGEKTMPARVIAALTEAGWTVALHPEAERPQIPHRDGYHLVLNNPVTSDRCLTLRPAGFEPFWQIESTNTRWDWQLASRPYQPPEVAPERLAAFRETWIRHLKLGPPGQGGGILVPLQGKLTERRGFQAASPLVMLVETLRRWPDRIVTATLHPSETYSPKETQALQQLARDFPNLCLGKAGVESCDLVVTENSTVALKGLFYDKPAILWARIDWHHALASVPRDGQEAALSAETKPDGLRYLFWYCRRQSLCAWEDNPKAIRNRLRALGWPVAEPK